MEFKYIWKHLFYFQFHALVFCSAVSDLFVKAVGGRNSWETAGRGTGFQVPDQVLGSGFSCSQPTKWPWLNSQVFKTAVSLLTAFFMRCSGVCDGYHWWHWAESLEVWLLRVCRSRCQGDTVPLLEPETRVGSCSVQVPLGHLIEEPGEVGAIPAHPVHLWSWLSVLTTPWLPGTGGLVGRSVTPVSRSHLLFASPVTDC